MSPLRDVYDGEDLTHSDLLALVEATVDRALNTTPVDGHPPVAVCTYTDGLRVTYIWRMAAYACGIVRMCIRY